MPRPGACLQQDLSQQFRRAKVVKWECFAAEDRQRGLVELDRSLQVVRLLAPDAFTVADGKTLLYPRPVSGESFTARPSRAGWAGARIDKLALSAPQFYEIHAHL
jgi:hypothetical protein